MPCCIEGKLRTQPGLPHHKAGPQDHQQSHLQPLSLISGYATNMHQNQSPIHKSEIPPASGQTLQV